MRGCTPEVARDRLDAARQAVYENAVDRMKEALYLRSLGHSVRYISEAIGMSERQVYRYMHERVSQ